MRSLPLMVSLLASAFALPGSPPSPSPSPQAQDSTKLGYYRTPSIRGGTVVFSAEGDLWMVPATGGEARRLTTHPAEETNPAIAPDGRSIAFTASYEGPAEVYVMPLDGGVPRRLTWDGARDVVVGWTRAGQVLYSTTRYSMLPNTQLAEVDPGTLKRTLLPLAQAADAAYDPATSTLFFTRLSRQSSNNRNYKGGTAQNIWRWRVPESLAAAEQPAVPEIKAAAGAVSGPGPGPGPLVPLVKGAPVPEATPLTSDYAGTSKSPMFWQGRVYFASDRSGVMNLWSMSPDGKDLKQLTKHADYELQSPAMDDGRIVYQDGADLWLYDTRTGQDARIPITLTSDYDQLRPRWVKKPTDWVTSAHFSPTGDRVVLTARGQLFVAPVAAGRLVQATKDETARARSGRFLDARTLVAMSDASGEVELWKLPANGVGSATKLTSGGDILRWDETPSPDGKLIAHTDKNQRLWLTDVATGKTTKLAESTRTTPGDLEWSPDSRWLVFSDAAPNDFSRLYLYDTRSASATPLTTDRSDASSPAFSPDGKWLWFLSDRTFRTVVPAPWGARQPEPFFDKQAKIYALALVPGARFPFAPADELSPADTATRGHGDTASVSEGSRQASGARSGSTSRPRVVASVEIALAGLPARLYEVPQAPAGNYSDLSTDGKRLYYLSREAGAREGADLIALDVSNDKTARPKTVLDAVQAYELSADRKKALVRKGGELYVFEASAVSKEKLADAKVDLSAWSFQVDPRQELAQMYAEAWRLERDYYWDPAMRGLDWPAIRAKYAPLAARVTSRAELSDVLAQMVAELETLHTFVRGGDLRAGEDNVLPASLGARLDRVPEGFRVAHIYRADPDEPGSLAPLARPGVDVHEGDVITSVNGVSAGSVGDLGELLRNLAGKQVLLAVSGPGPGPKGGVRDVVVVPMTPAEEQNLRYSEWELTRRVAVDSMSQGKIGYLHLRAMGGDDMNQFARDFYPNLAKDALVVDMRSNRGGNIDSWVLEKLMRRPWMFFQPRVGDPSWNMQWAFRGPMVVLVNENTASDGEAFAEGFRRLGLGKVIGTRTWGGEIWLSSNNFLVDRGIATAAETGVYGPEGQWLIEGHGVDPDVVVDDPPAETFAGKDAQLEAAVRYLTEELTKRPVETPKAPGRPKVKGQIH
jgi:tricorn protease